jgi:hypothetical protein
LGLISAFQQVIMIFNKSIEDWQDKKAFFPRKVSLQPMVNR